MKFRKELLFTLLIHSAHGDWIDVDTPEDKRTTTSFVDGTEYELVSRNRTQKMNVFEL